MKKIFKSFLASILVITMLLPNFVAFITIRIMATGTVDSNAEDVYRADMFMNSSSQEAINWLLNNNSFVYPKQSDSFSTTLSQIMSFSLSKSPYKVAIKEILITFMKKSDSNTANIRNEERSAFYYDFINGINDLAQLSGKYDALRVELTSEKLEQLLLKSRVGKYEIFHTEFINLFPKEKRAAAQKMIEDYIASSDYSSKISGGTDFSGAVTEILKIAKTSVDTYIELRTYNRQDQQFIDFCYYLSKNSQFDYIRDVASELYDALSKTFEESQSKIIVEIAKQLASNATSDIVELCVSKIATSLGWSSWLTAAKIGIDAGMFVSDQWFSTKATNDISISIRVCEELTEDLKNFVSSRINAYKTKYKNNSAREEAAEQLVYYTRLLYQIRVLGENLFMKLKGTVYHSQMVEAVYTLGLYDSQKDIDVINSWANNQSQKFANIENQLFGSINPSKYMAVSFDTGNISSSISSKYITGTYQPSEWDGCNIRSGASTSYSIVGAIAAGTSFAVTKVSGNWGYTTCNGKTGWVCLDFATFINSSTSSTSTATTIASNYATGTYKPSEYDGCYIRSGTSTSYSIVGAIAAGTSFVVTKVSGNWGYTTCNGKTGWVCLDFATYLNSSTSAIISNDANNVKLTDANVDDYVGKKILDVKNASVTTRITKNGNVSIVTHNPYVYDGYCDNGTKQCVDYAWARIQEKLKFRPNWTSGHAKDIPAYAPKDRKMMSAENVEYTVKVYTNDNGANIQANSLVSFGAVSGNAYGHVIYVVYVKKENGTTYVYFTHGGVEYYNSGVSGTLYKKTLSDLLKTWGAYVGTVVFVPDREPENLTPKEYYLDLNAYLDGEGVSWLDKFGTADVYINGKCVANDVNDYYTMHPVGTTYEIKDIRAKNGYTYNGVYGNTPLKGTIQDGKVSVFLNFSTYIPKTYTISYNANGGSGVPGAQTKTEKTAVSISTQKPTRDGYAFSGWATTSSGSAVYKAGQSYSADADITLYAVWEANTYTISYNANGGNGAPSSQSKKHGTNITLSAQEPKRDGYVFIGWAVGTEGDVKYSSGDVYKENKTLYLHAVWTANTYTISYNANGGSSAPQNQTKTHDEPITLSNINPTKENSKFVGWASAPDAKSAVYFAGDVFEQNADTLLYAVWEEIINEDEVAEDVHHQEALPFEDVPESAWYRQDVESAYRSGLINGKSERRYAPNDNITYAEAIKLACTIYQLYFDGEVTLSNGSDVWYSTYMNYAIENRIVRTDYSSIANKYATRKEFVSIFYGALPLKEFATKNEIKDDSIPDVKIGDAYAGEIYTFYRAGILTGNDTKGTFYPERNISRSEVAALVTRMLDRGSRKEARF